MFHINPERMTATAMIKNLPYLKELMAVADPPKEDSAVKNMKSRSLLLSSNEMTHYFKE